MISLIIPPRDQISRISKMLADELGTASNIKSRVNRLSVRLSLVLCTPRPNTYAVCRHHQTTRAGTAHAARCGRRKQLLREHTPARAYCGAAEARARAEPTPVVSLRMFDLARVARTRRFVALGAVRNHIDAAEAKVVQQGADQRTRHLLRHHRHRCSRRHRARRACLCRKAAILMWFALADEGKEKKVNIDFEPFRPINTSLYLCDNKFHTEVPPSQLAPRGVALRCSRQSVPHTRYLSHCCFRRCRLCRSSFPIPSAMRGAAIKRTALLVRCTAAPPCIKGCRLTSTEVSVDALLQGLKELLENDEKYGFVVMDGHGSLFGTLSGNTREVRCALIKQCDGSVCTSVSAHVC